MACVCVCECEGVSSWSICTQLCLELSLLCGGRMWWEHCQAGMR